MKYVWCDRINDQLILMAHDDRIAPGKPQSFHAKNDVYYIGIYD